MAAMVEAVGAESHFMHLFRQVIVTSLMLAQAVHDHANSAAVHIHFLVYKQLRPIKRQNHIFRHFSLLRFVGNPAAFSIRDYEKIINVENEQKRGRFLGTDTFIMLHRKKSFRRHSSHATSHGNTVQRPFPPQMASRSYSMAINHIMRQVVCTQTSLYVALFCIG